MSLFVCYVSCLSILMQLLAYTQAKTSQITITNDKGRLDQDEINRMVKEAVQFKEQDAQQRKKVEAKNSLETYTYALSDTLSSDKDKLASLIDAQTLEEFASKIQETITWIDNHDLDVELEEVEAIRKELEAIAMPIITTLKQQQVRGGTSSGNNYDSDDDVPDSDDDMPDLESMDVGPEVDNTPVSAYDDDSDEIEEVD
jgi:heat shock protein 1/8